MVEHHSLGLCYHHSPPPPSSPSLQEGDDDHYELNPKDGGTSSHGKQALVMPRKPRLVPPSLLEVMMGEIITRCSSCNQVRVIWAKDTTFNTSTTSTSTTTTTTITATTIPPSCFSFTCQECVAANAENCLKQVGGGGNLSIPIYCCRAKCHRLSYRDLKMLWERGLLSTTSMSRGLLLFLSQQELSTRTDGHDSLVLIKCPCGDRQVIDLEFDQWAKCRNCGQITCAKHHQPVVRKARSKVRQELLNMVYHQEVPVSIYQHEYVKVCDWCLLEATEEEEEEVDGRGHEESKHHDGRKDMQKLSCQVSGGYDIMFAELWLCV